MQMGLFFFPGPGHARSAPILGEIPSLAEKSLFVEVKPPKDLLTNEEFRAWAHPNKWRLAWDLFGVWLQIGIAIALCLLFPSPGVYLISIILIGGAQHACGLISHEGAHYLIVPHNRPLNDRLTRWLFAAPVLLPFSTYRQRHLDHHRFVSTEDDTKEQYRRNFRGIWLVWEIARSLLGLDFFKLVLSTIQGQARKTERKVARKKGNLVVDIGGIVCAQVVLLALFSLQDWRLYILLWLYPMFTFAQLFAKIRSAGEHQPLDSEVVLGSGPYFKGTDKPYLRSIDPTPIECLLLSRINFHYHAEHHLWPQICYQFLPILSQRLRAQKDFHGVSYERSYFHVILKLARGL